MQNSRLLQNQDVISLTEQDQTLTNQRNVNVRQPQFLATGNGFGDQQPQAEQQVTHQISIAAPPVTTRLSQSEVPQYMGQQRESVAGRQVSIRQFTGCYSVQIPDH